MQQALRDFMVRRGSRDLLGLLEGLKDLTWKCAPRPDCLAHYHDLAACFVKEVLVANVKFESLLMRFTLVSFMWNHC